MDLRKCINVLWVLFVSLFKICECFPSIVKAEEEPALHGVVVLFRHGDRAPCCDNTWPTDPYYWNMSLWQDGHGQLNNMGKRRQFKLGQWFRSRYENFLPLSYNRSDIFIRSTNVDRTLMSALSNLAGLYLPVKDQIWNENIQWQPIPVHTVPANQDGILAFGESCQKYDRLKNETLAGKQLNDIMMDHKDTLNRLSENTGIQNITLGDVAGIFSSVTIYRQFNLTLPSWTYVLWNEIEELAAIGFQLNTFTPELAKLRTGMFFNYLLNHLYSLKSQTINNFSDDNYPKFLMLSAHDDTLSDITNSMGVFQGSVPEFASTVIWELKSINNEFFVNMYFRNSTNLVEMELPDCQYNCFLNKFANALAGVTLDEESWKLQCQDS